MTKAADLRELTDDVLELRLAEAKDELFKLRFGHHGGNHPVRHLPTGRVEITRSTVSSNNTVPYSSSTVQSGGGVVVEVVQGCRCGQAGWA